MELVNVQAQFGASSAAQLGNCVSWLIKSASRRSEIGGDEPAEHFYEKAVYVHLIENLNFPEATSRLG
jgi:hypothetical protein